MSRHTDQQLLDWARAGDHRAFARLMARHQRMVLVTALRIVRVDWEAADIAQDTFCLAWQRLPQLRGDFAPWVRQIASNGALMRLRARRRAVRLSTPEWRGVPAGPEAQLLGAELEALLAVARSALPKVQREAYELRELEGLGYQDIAGRTRASVQNVRSRLHRARLALREAISVAYSERRPWPEVGSGAQNVPRPAAGTRLANGTC